GARIFEIFGLIKGEGRIIKKIEGNRRKIGNGKVKQICGIIIKSAGIKVGRGVGVIVCGIEGGGIEEMYIKGGYREMIEIGVVLSIGSR
ncbi:hypothetical protein, partial [Staphylococcus capitis]|uniref:hypothetical protein n=1 Tax=Staphylococcus capitis TaxID=29388 RepID=UPI001C93102D